MTNDVPFLQESELYDVYVLSTDIQSWKAPDTEGPSFDSRQDARLYLQNVFWELTLFLGSKVARWLS